MRQDNTTIIIHRSDDPFARVPKAVLNDERLSWKAKGILAYLLGKPKDWQTQTSDLVRRSPDGKHAVLSGLKEIIDCGYARREWVRDGGKIKGCNLYVSDTPIFSKGSPYPENQDTAPQPDFPDTGNLDTENQPLTKTDFNSEREETKKEPSDPPLPSVEDAATFIDAYEHAYRLANGKPYPITSATRKKIARWFEENTDFSVPRLVKAAIDMWLVDTSGNPKHYFFTRKNLHSPMGFLTTFNEITNELGHYSDSFKWSSQVKHIYDDVCAYLKRKGS